MLGMNEIPIREENSHLIMQSIKRIADNRLVIDRFEYNKSINKQSLLL